MTIRESIVIVVALVFLFPPTCFGASNNDLTVLFTGDLSGQITPRPG